jgi:hypothetical protein
MFVKLKNFAKKNPYKFSIIIISIIIVICLVITLPIVLTKTNNNHQPSASASASANITTSPITIPNTTTTPHLPTNGIIGAWAGRIGCGDGTFNIISLGSALPQDYKITGLNDFFGKIEGTFNNNLSNGKTKYIISVGGSAASIEGWTSFLTQITSNQQNVINFINGCKCRGVVGIDFDLEQTTQSMIPNIINLVNQIKMIDNNFIVMYTILLGSPDTYANLLNTSNYDYLSLMLYNGGMYEATGSGAGCDWDGWAELILSKGTAGCKYPLRDGCISKYTPDCDSVQSAFAQTANLKSINPAKVLLGLIIDTQGKKLDPSILARANQLNSKYGGAGIMIWVIPGWVNTDNITQLNNMGFNIDASKCSGSGGGGSTTCPTVAKPCSNGMAASCVASECGITMQNVKDSDCAPCAQGQTWWPCGDLNFCETKSNTPKPTPASQCF